MRNIFEKFSFNFKRLFTEKGEMPKQQSDLNFSNNDRQNPSSLYDRRKTSVNNGRKSSNSISDQREYPNNPYNENRSGSLYDVRPSGSERLGTNNLYGGERPTNIHDARLNSFCGSDPVLLQKPTAAIVNPQRPKVSKSQLREYREAFRVFDKDGDGNITKEELGRVMRSLGQFATKDELDEMLNEIDIDGDGAFSFNEFVEIICNMGRSSGERSVEDEERELRDAFKIFDKHGRGYISASDLRAVLRCLGEDLSEEEIEDMIREVDIDGDGRIDFNEFVKALADNNSDDEEDYDTNEEEETEGGAVGGKEKQDVD